MSLQLTAKKLAEYRNGGEGFVKWCNENVRISIYAEGSDGPSWCLLGELPSTPNPYTGRSYRSMWESQQTILKKALAMKTEPNGTRRFIHRLIILCWMRGEGKSAVVCLIQMWKFFCWPKQQIVLGANSKDQTKFVHYDIIREMIMNSPNLLEWVGGPANVQEKMICMRDSKGAVVSAIRSISSFSGIVSNITGYTFSEMFDMNNPKFFTQLDGSTRNVPNAMGTIDSTVSTKDHVLYKMYEASLTKSIPDLFFSYRCSPAGDANDFYHPQMTQAQLDSYKEKFPLAEFDRYFKNLWDAGAVRFFTDVDVEMINYWGVNNLVNVPDALKSKMQDINTRKNTLAGHKQELLERKGDAPTLERIYNTDVATLNDMYADLYPVESTFALADQFGEPLCASAQDLYKMGQMFQTDWSIHVGLDRADPMSLETATRTILTMTAKGLPGSLRGFRAMMMGEEPPYVYITIGFQAFKAHNLDDIKRVILEWNQSVDGIDTFCSERWGAWDLEKWCLENGISCELISPTYEKQRSSFNEFYNLVKQGRYKCPPTHFVGSREDDVIKEEMRIFNHDPDKKWFGSPEKHAKNGIQDDCMYSIGWGIYGGRNTTFENFRPRGRRSYMVGYIPAQGLLGKY